MTVLIEQVPAVDAEGYEALVVRTSNEDGRCILYLSGELDGSSAGRLLRAAVEVRQAAVVIDMASVTFMDCSGYGSVLAATRMFDRRGQTAVIQGLTGQPARLAALIARPG